MYKGKGKIANQKAQESRGDGEWLATKTLFFSASGRIRLIYKLNPLVSDARYSLLIACLYTG